MQGADIVVTAGTALGGDLSGKDFDGRPNWG